MNPATKHTIINTTTGRFPNVSKDSYMESPAPYDKCIYGSASEARAKLSTVEKEGRAYERLLSWCVKDYTDKVAEAQKNFKKYAKGFRDEAYARQYLQGTKKRLKDEQRNLDTHKLRVFKVAKVAYTIVKA
jgi:hypothetical protein